MKTHRPRAFAFLLIASLASSLTATQAFGAVFPLEFKGEFHANYNVFATAHEQVDLTGNMKVDRTGGPTLSLDIPLVQKQASACDEDGERCGSANASTRSRGSIGGAGRISLSTLSEASAQGFPGAATAAAFLRGDVRWMETFQFLGPTGVDLTYVLTGNVGGVLQTEGDFTAAEWSYTLSSTPESGVVTVIKATERRIPARGDELDFDATPFTIVGRTGDRLQVEELFEFLSVAERDEPGRARTEVDFEHTGQFFLDPITPGASYITASGFDYRSSPAAVPEPATITLLCAGVAVTLVFGRRRPSTSVGFDI